MNLRARAYALFEGLESPASKFLNYAIMALIVLNITALILETVEGIHSPFADWFRLFDLLSVALFSLEYLTRIWFAPENPKYRGAVRGRLKYLHSPMALVDLIAILPFYLPFVGVDMRHLRAVRLFRIFKILRYSKTLKLFQKVFIKKREELFVTFLVLMFMLLFSASMMYFAEHEAQPDHFSSIPASMWWAIVTLTTVGYGDVFPITLLGKMFAASIAVVGIGLFALPTGILGSAFVEEVESQKQSDTPPEAFTYCPHCGKNLPSGNK
ncbi:MAG: ion transporter [Candidatus Sericytochromatia bacterium]|nr:ion transporter [Candidatus Sericytochromatia bacterium]